MTNQELVHDPLDRPFGESCHRVLGDEVLVGLEEAGEKWNVHLAFRSSRNEKGQAWREVFLVLIDKVREEKAHLGEVGVEEEVGGNSFQKIHLKGQEYQLQKTGMKILVILLKRESLQEVTRQEYEGSQPQGEDSQAQGHLQTGLEKTKEENQVVHATHPLDESLF